MPENTLFACNTEEDETTLFNPVHPLWNSDYKINIDRLSTGSSALAEKGYGWTNLTQVSSVWNDSALFFYFECWHSRAVDPKPAENAEVDEAILLIRPEGCEDSFRVTVNSLGYLSAAHVLQLPEEIDRAWNSAANTQVLVSDTEQIWRAFLQLPYEPMTEASNFGRRPEMGDAWRLNLHRTAGQDENREHLWWRPSYSAAPDSFVFGHLIFLGAP
jgi:hypothetical protein